MLKKIWFSFLLLLLCTLCVYSIVLMYQNDRNFELEVGQLKEEVDLTDTYNVGKGDIKQEITVKGKVSPMDEEAVYQVNIIGKPSSVKINIKEGDLVKKDTVIAKYKNKEYKVKSSMYCIRINKSESGISIALLDYSKLYITLSMPVNYIEDDLQKKKCNIVCGKETFEGTITYIDAFCTDNAVSVKAEYDTNQFKLRPGTDCTASIVLEEKKNVITVPTSLVLYNEIEKEYRVLLVNDETMRTQTIEVGIISNDMVEVISGLSENDIVSFPAVEKSLQFYLENKQSE